MMALLAQVKDVLPVVLTALPMELRVRTAEERWHGVSVMAKVLTLVISGVVLFLGLA